MRYKHFEKVDGFIAENNITNYLGLFNYDEKIESIFDRIRYLVMVKSNISDVYSYKCEKIKINSDDD